MKIQNPQSQTIAMSNGPQMRDGDYINDVLATEKHLTDNFNVFSREASHYSLHNDVNRILFETHQCTRNLFNLMFKKGLYSFDSAQSQEIQQTKQEYESYRNQFPHGNYQM